MLAIRRLQLVDFSYMTPSLLRLLRLLKRIIFETIFLFLWSVYFPLDVILVNVVEYRSKLVVLLNWSKNYLPDIVECINVIISMACLLLCSVLFILIVFIKLLQIFVYFHFLAHNALSLNIMAPLAEIKVFWCVLLLSLILLILLYWLYLIFYFKVLYLWLLLYFIFIT